MSWTTAAAAAAAAWDLQACMVLQGTGLAEHRDSGAPAPIAAGIRMHLPDLSRLSRLTALNLSDNRLTRVPPVIGKLKQLQMLDLSCNQELQVCLLLCTIGGDQLRSPW